MSRERGLPDVVLLGAVATLCGIGLTMIFSASSATAASYATMAYFWQQQCLWLGVGILAAFGAYHVPLRWLRAAAAPIVILALAALALPFVPHLGVDVNGAHRWIHLGRFSLQPSEFAKVALVIGAASWFARRSGRRARLASTLRGLAPALAMCALILAEPDLGTAAIVGAIAFVMLFVAGVPIWQLALVAMGALGCMGGLVLRHAAWLARLAIFLDPWRDPRNAGFHIIQSLYALGSGGLTGVGLGGSSEKFYYLPEQYTDFIFSVLGEELGMVGTVCVVLLFLLIAYRAYRIAVHTPDRFSRLLVIGCAAMIVVQAFVNVGVVTSSLPVTGVPLPFISFGGSSLVASLLAVALMLNVASHRRAASAASRRRRFQVIDGMKKERATAEAPVAAATPLRSVPAAKALELFEPSTKRFEALWEIERAILDASFAFETTVHAPSEAQNAWLMARDAASRFGEVFQANCMSLPEYVTPDLIKLHRRFAEIFQAYFRHLVGSNGDTRIAFAHARANGDLVLGDISHCLEVVEDALRRESGNADELPAPIAQPQQKIREDTSKPPLRRVPRNAKPEPERTRSASA